MADIDNTQLGGFDIPGIVIAYVATDISLRTGGKKVFEQTCATISDRRALDLLRRCLCCRRAILYTQNCLLLSLDTQDTFQTVSAYHNARWYSRKGCKFRRRRATLQAQHARQLPSDEQSQSDGLERSRLSSCRARRQRSPGTALRACALSCDAQRRT